MFYMMLIAAMGVKMGMDPKYIAGGILMFVVVSAVNFVRRAVTVDV